MNTERLKETLTRVSFFMTRPGMIFVNLVAIIMLYSFNLQLLGFFYIIGLILSLLIRATKTPEGQFFHPVSYYGNDHNKESYLKANQEKKAAYVQRQKQLSTENHEKIHDEHEMKQINRKLKEIEEELNGQ